MLLAVLDFIADDATQLGIDLFLVLSVADATKVEIRAVADVELVVVRPADEAVILICGLHNVRELKVQNFKPQPVTVTQAVVSEARGLNIGVALCIHLPVSFLVF